MDNVEKDKSENKEGKCFKVKPLLEAVKANCQKVKQEVNNSIDEQISQQRQRRVEVFDSITLKNRINEALRT